MSRPQMNVAFAVTSDRQRRPAERQHGHARIQPQSPAARDEERSSLARLSPDATMDSNRPSREAERRFNRMHGNKHIPALNAAVTKQRHHQRDLCPASPARELQPGWGHPIRGRSENRRVSFSPNNRLDPPMSPCPRDVAHDVPNELRRGAARVDFIRLSARCSPGMGAPRMRSSGKLLAHIRPVVKRARVKIRPIRPHEGPDLGVQRHRVERSKVLQRTKQRPVKDWLEVDALLGAIRECHRQYVRADDPEPRHAVDWMSHGST